MFHANYLFFILLLFVSSNLSANVMIPPLLMVWPLFWLAFIPVVFIETIVMQKFFKTETFEKLLLVNTASNGLSTFVGVPIAFFVALLALAMPVNVLVIKAYWWVLRILIVIGVFSLFPLFFFVSIRIEQWAIIKILDKKYERETIKQAVKAANKASYIFLFFVYVIVVAAYYLTYI